MRNKETGEFELVVGNGQLVSGFFIVVLLFAVGVAMGYILGQNSEKSAKNQTGETAPCVAADARPQPSQSAPATPAATQTPDPPASSGDGAPAPTTQPAKEPDPAPATQPAKQDPPPAPKKEAPKEAAPQAAANEVPTGSFWQVTASANMEAVRAILNTLKGKGFPAYTTPGPNGLTRVVVGPYPDSHAKAKAKTELEGLGLPAIAFSREK
jgi:cell division septation protein DedD